MLAVQDTTEVDWTAHLYARPKYVLHCRQKIAREARTHLLDHIGCGTCTELRGTLRCGVHGQTVQDARSIHISRTGQIDWLHGKRGHILGLAVVVDVGAIFATGNAGVGAVLHNGFQGDLGIAPARIGSGFEFVGKDQVGVGR